jgi:phenylacetate-CoA ligase
VDAAVNTPAPVLAGFDPGPEIRRSVRGHERYVPRLRAGARDLARFARMRGAPEQSTALETRLAALRRSLWRSPHYLAVFRHCGLSPGDLRTLGDLRHFPRLDRETLRDAFSEIPSLPPGPAGRLLVERSSGSTGQPVGVLKEDYDTVHMWAVLRFWVRWLRLRLPARPRVALVCTLPHGVEYETPLPALGGGTLVRISIRCPHPAERLRHFHPHVVFSDPAGLHWLADQSQPPRPRLLLSSAMHLSPHLRRHVEGTLGAPVVNYYSTSETGPIAWECLEVPACFHVLLPDAWVEAVDGELVVTRLRASVLPLLRYRTGDRGDVRPDRCRCGYRGLSIRGLIGRRACVFLAPGGREVDAWQLAWVFRHHCLDGFRLTQEAPDAFRLETTGEAGVPEGALAPRAGEAAGPGAGTDGLAETVRRTLVSLGWAEPRIERRRVTREALASAKPEPFACHEDMSPRGAPFESGHEGSAVRTEPSGPIRGVARDGNRKDVA